VFGTRIDPASYTNATEKSIKVAIAVVWLKFCIMGCGVDAAAIVIFTFNSLLDFAHHILLVSHPDHHCIGFHSEISYPGSNPLTFG